MKRKIILILALLIIMCTISCSTTIKTCGSGSAKNHTEIIPAF
jgi:hypothetical protein